MLANGSEQYIRVGPKSSNPRSPAYTEQEICLVYATILAAEIGKGSKIAKIHFLDRGVPAA
jgi:hypothetical protein